MKLFKLAAVIAVAWFSTTAALAQSALHRSLPTVQDVILEEGDLSTPTENTVAPAQPAGPNSSPEPTPPPQTPTVNEPATGDEGTTTIRRSQATYDNDPAKPE